MIDKVMIVAPSSLVKVTNMACYCEIAGWCGSLYYVVTFMLITGLESLSLCIFVFQSASYGILEGGNTVRPEYCTVVEMITSELFGFNGHFLMNSAVIVNFLFSFIMGILLVQTKTFAFSLTNCRQVFSWTSTVSASSSILYSDRTAVYVCTVNIVTWWHYVSWSW